ncbi:putative 3-dehydrosphinganine reductase [Helianthus annuus]|nr:putative 3-dehydrosphinganine reductase [Helianthus annuus]KAJ0958563.1 putative 3-dehydrosphinganine reductase [Helianthus annuus]
MIWFVAILFGSFNLVKAVLPGMKSRSDRKPVSIAFMSSQAGQVIQAYSASKFGLRGLAEALQQEVIANDIHVLLIFPRDTDTPGFAEGSILPSCMHTYIYTDVGMLNGSCSWVGGS